MNTKIVERVFCVIFILALVAGAISMPGLRVKAQESLTPELWVVNLPTNEFFVQDWPAGRIVTATIDDPATAQNPDFTDIQVTEATDDCNVRPACATFHLPEGYYLAPFWTITVIDDQGITINFKLADVKATSWDLQADTVTGTVQPVVPYSRVSVLFFYPADCSPEGDYVSMDDQGNWTADFSGYCDIVPGSAGALNYIMEEGGVQGVQIGSWGIPALTLKGFYQPVDMNGVYNVVKTRSTVPFKFEIFAGSNELTDTTEIDSFVSTQIACDASAMIDNIETTATGSTSLRYDPSAGQFIYNWKTPEAAGTCYQVTLTTVDGSSLVAYFKLK